MSIQQEKFTEIADAIRAKTGEVDLIKPSEFACKVSDVYDAGAKSEYDRFWDDFQQNGNRTNYNGGFYGVGWNNETFKPKYDIRPGRDAVSSMFRENSITGDLKKLLDDLGVVLDTSKVYSFSYCFHNTKLEALPFIDISGESSGYTNNIGNAYTFASAPNLKSLEIKVGEKTLFNNVFNSSPAIEEIYVTGTIAQNGFNVQWSNNLTHDSLMSIINALKTFTDGGTHTITLGSTNLAKLTDEEKQIITNKGWTY